MYRYMGPVVEHRLDVIAELQWHRFGQSAGDDYVARLKLPTTPGQLRNKPHDTGRRMAGRR